MSQTFRLRLGDGTILRVDHGGLSTWESDPTAAVGTRDPKKWIPLKEFLIQERAAELRRAREGEERAILPPPPEENPPLKVSDRGEEPPRLVVAPAALFVPEEPRPPDGPEAAAPSPIAEEIDLNPLAAESMGAPTVAPPSLEDLPVIPLKSLDGGSEPRVPERPESTAPAADAPSVVPLAEEPPAGAGARSLRGRVSGTVSEPGPPVPLPGLVTAALQWSNVLGMLLSRGLAPINRLEQGLPLFGIDDPTASLPSHSSLTGEIALPTLSLDFDGARARVSASLRELSDRSRGWMNDVAARVSGLVAARRAQPAGSVPPSEEPALPAPDGEAPTPFAPVPVAPAPLVPVEPIAADLASPGPSLVSAQRRRPQTPPAVAQLPALRLAPVSEPRTRGDVYAGDVDAGAGFPFWRWTRRLLLTAAVLAGGVLAGTHREIWSPSASGMGLTLLEEINDRVRWLHLARERQEVVEQASEQLPHLARDTVGLILATSRTHVLEPPAVFETAWSAAERGESSLSASEVEELEALRRELVDALPPLDRDRLRAFGQAHAQGAVFPFDARRGLQSYARGVRALPPERRVRLQTLLGKAIAAGLDS